jgi:hypothetical protein
LDLSETPNVRVKTRKLTISFQSGIRIEKPKTDQFSKQKKQVGKLVKLKETIATVNIFGFYQKSIGF